MKTTLKHNFLTLLFPTLFPRNNLMIPCPAYSTVTRHHIIPWRFHLSY